MMDESERHRRSHKDELKLTTKELQVDCFNHAAKEVAFCITYCGFILLLYTQIMDILYHIGLAENWNAVKSRKDTASFKPLEEGHLKQDTFTEMPELEIHVPSSSAIWLPRGGSRWVGCFPLITLVPSYNRDLWDNDTGMTVSHGILQAISQQSSAGQGFSIYSL